MKWGKDRKQYTSLGGAIIAILLLLPEPFIPLARYSAPAF